MSKDSKLYLKYIFFIFILFYLFFILRLFSSDFQFV